ncbi:MAG: hypothetical protein RMY28_007490 [Nostoc sp. ChiSLP01]|nr:hypothetical protein [Nostoc sp. CmiSLP01]MDZ8283405.1 hypothetical protein [Nostoc sp. ChiSLP01]
MTTKYLTFQKTKIFLLIAYSLPIILTFWFVTSFSVNVPVWDDWELVSFFDKIHNGTVRFADFFAQHNEHRIFFPRIIFAILAFSSNWNIKVETCFSLLLTLANFAMMYKIASLSFNKKNRVLCHLFNITISILTFSLTQYENWLWGFQIAWFLINTCVITAVFILVVFKNWLPNLRISLASLCCLIASFSSAHGLLSWLALIPSLYLVEGKSNQKKIRLLVWMILFTSCVAIYSIGYQKPSHHPGILFILQNPLIATEYFMTIIGSSVSTNVLPPIVTGVPIFFSFLFFSVFCIKNYQSEFTNNAGSWLSIGWFATLFAIMTTIGRAGFGVEQALASRYRTVLILLVISCLQLWRLWILDRWQRSRKNTYIFSITSRSCIALLIAVFIFESINNNIVIGKNVWRAHNAAKHCLEVRDFLDSQSPNNCLQMFYPQPLRLIELSKTLQNLGFREFPKNIIFTTKTAKVYGNIDVPPTVEEPLILRQKDTIKWLGWGVLRERHEQPYIVLLSYGNNQSFFAYGLITLNRPDVAKALNSSLYGISGWEANVSLKSIPLGETVIKAWVYDQEGQQFIQLNGETKIKVVE